MKVPRFVNRSVKVPGLPPLLSVPGQEMVDAPVSRVIERIVGDDRVIVGVHVDPLHVVAHFYRQRKRLKPVCFRHNNLMMGGAAGIVRAC